MKRKERSWRSKAVLVLSVSVVGGLLMFGSFGSESGPLGIGQRTVTAQASGALEGQTVTLQPSAAVVPESASPVAPSAAQRAAGEAHIARSAAAWAARSNGLPAGNPRGLAAGGAVGPAAGSESSARALRPLDGPGPLADGDATYFKASQLNPASAGLGSSSVNEPAVAQNGKYVFETWNWGAARSVNGGTTWAYISPYAGMADFCCDQDVIYDKGRDRMFWLRQGVVAFASPAGGTENRDFLTIDTGAASLCTYDIRPSTFGHANAWFDYPRISLSNNFLYLVTNIFNSSTNAFITHKVIRIPLTAAAACGTISLTNWTFSAGWSPATVENAREIMYLGDQIVTSTGLNSTFRVYWIFDDSATLFSVDRTIAPYLHTNRVGSGFHANCPVPGGADPCERSDQRITGAVLEHNTPLPGNLGAAGDKIDFYWNVREGNGFSLPYVESAGFFGNTIAYAQRKFIWSSGVTFFYAAAGANDREHVGISLFQFNPVASGAHPYHLIGIDDDYNTNPPGWEIYVTYASTGAWTASNSGDYLRVRQHSPAGVAWIASGYTRNAALGQYLPHYIVFGRARDLNGYNRFALQ